jgi:hypothetical protein
LEKLRLESKKAELDTRRELSDLKKEIREQQIAPYKEAFQSARERFGEAQRFLQPAEQPRQLTQAEFQQMQQPCPQIPQVKERTIEDWIGSSDHARKRTRIEDFI